ncbi:hypothetical protein IAD21_03287 [Abditibacteriota bacterium]|nr:hypothetical protein IAD21_03287 [Abditibacteriota bacterium]
MNLRFPLILTVLCLLGVSVGAQTVLTPVAPAEVQTSLPVLVEHSTPELNHIRELFVQGLYLQLIERTTDALDKGKTEALAKNEVDKPDPELLYWRGFARRRCGLFKDALADLQSLGNMTGYANFVTAAQLTTEIGLLLEQRPPNEYDIRNDSKVIFRVYYNEDDEFLRTVLDALPKGYTAASSFIGLQADEIPIFVFNSAHYSQFVKFFTTLSDGPLQGWWRIGNRNGTITISQNNLLESPLPSNYPDMARLMSHEMTHLLIYRIVGDLKDFPTWFNEGTARCGEGVYEPEFYIQNDRKIRQLLAQNAILSLNQIVSPSGFYYSVDQMKKGTQPCDAYAQGFSMTRYLGVLLKGEKLRYFLNDIQEKGFEAVLKTGTGMTSDEFYQSWLDEINDANR